MVYGVHISEKYGKIFELFPRNNDIFCIFICIYSRKVVILQRFWNESHI